MKQMSLIEMDGFLKGKCIPSDLKVNETNAEYLVRKFAEAEAKCAALSAENELARKAVQAFCDVVGDSTEVICEEIGRDGVLVILEAMKATGNMPATDAFLAEVRAEARNEGINYTASRLAAAFNHGFLDKPVSEVLDAFVLYAQYRDGEFFDIVRNGDEFFETQSRNVTDWMQLPEPPL
ncbi:DUF551 domain-containing protein [Salmonella enterica]|nr:DUF551 domain-containing protein [Salmonella enterica]